MGVNIGEAAGQTVPHLHIHLIPRYGGDVDDPRGGVRHVLPDRACYFLPRELEADRVADRPALPTFVSLLVGGEEDPLLPHIQRHLDEAERCDLLVAFVLESAVHRLEEHLRDLLDRKGRVRLLTGDTLGITEPNALLRLLDLEEPGHPRRPRLRLGREELSPQGLHLLWPSLRFYGPRSVAYIGSSNLSASALTEGIEWNYRIVAGGPGTSPL